jgi:hypothetical protein
MTYMDLNKLVKLVVCISLAIFLCVVSSCKESPQIETGSPDSSAVNAGQTQAAVEQTPAAVVAKTTEQTKAAADSSGLVPIGLQLPKALFIGTPQAAIVDNLEKPLGTPRPPFLAPAGTKNVALGKPVTASDKFPIIGDLKLITDGDMDSSDGKYVEFINGVQYITVDLGAVYNIYAVVVWHLHKQPVVFFDVIVQTANDSLFIENVNTIFNNDMDNSAGLGIGKDMHYTETNEGKLIDAKGVQGRYVRLYSSGYNLEEFNYYVEVAVYGKAVE